MTNLTSTKVMYILANSDIARNNYKEWYLEFIKEFYCKNFFERFIVTMFWKITKWVISQATFQRECAYIQNNLNKCIPDLDVKIKREKHRKKLNKIYGI